jgi:hypothetical protein
MKFKCKTTNLVYNFEHAVDIVSMEKHPDYESVPDNEAVPESELVVAPKATKKTVVKQDEDTINGI